MEQVKLRIIKPKQTNSTQVYGFTVPPKMALFYSNKTYFNVTKSGNAIIYTSGTKLSEIPTDGLDLEDFKTS